MSHRFRIVLSRLTGEAPPHGRRDFHVQKGARDELGIDDAFFTSGGDVVFPTLERSQLFAALLNEKQALAPAQALQASQVNAMGLVHEVFHAVIAAWRAKVAPEAFRSLQRRLSDQLGPALETTLRRFLEAFPPPAVYRGSQTPDQYLRGASAGVPHREMVLEELLLLWLGNQNPAYAPIRAITSDEPLRNDPGYLKVIQSAGEHFANAPGFGPNRQTLLDLLLAPIRHAPDSLSAQLEFMRAHWGLLLEGNRELLRLLLGLDFLSEENRWLARRGQHFDPQQSPPLGPQVFAGAEYEAEPERFSPDLDWMPRVVMLAKSTFVWLDQLGKQHGRPIRTLSDVPDSELDQLQARGYTALWLIGLWRRSRASQRIKQINGNAEAVASAYSLFDYEIAPELGGHAAYENLRERCAQRRIRLASDMVPNHMGIDSVWVVEHPEWFLQTDHPPFPSHRFDGPDLSDDPRAAIQIEDGYYSKTDAAVVFRRTDRHTGQTRYLYHGNDGTSMPWNDTAQLNYLKAEVREAVIQTILHVARLFPIIRFDAAMTLAKRHYQRLWFPVPGSGGDIPSRAQHAMSKERFDQLFPVEFWREVVDRVAREVPGTLLLAEAFWMMEGYFVRTLGMHRVYNSAFMNMLKKEENANYRTTLKNTLEFNPQILKRYVNFMNNPDEDTAIAQFGRDDKYFGVSVLLATLPGLPMFGHGQVEGYTERYGMEYQRAYRDERPDEGLVARHMREIVPLLRRRWLFSDVEGFYLYDFITPEGHVDEDVFAYSNRKGEERALILFNNRFKTTRGRIRFSVGQRDGAGALVTRSVFEGLALNRESGVCTVFRDVISGLEHIVLNQQIADEGLPFELGAFKYRALLDFREVRDDGAHPWVRLARRLGGAGVPSMAEALLDERLRPLHQPLQEAVSRGSAEYFLPAGAPQEPSAALPALRQHLPALRQHLIEKLTRTLQGLVLVDTAAPAPAGLVEALADRHARARGQPAALRDPQLWLSVLFVDALRNTAGDGGLRALHLALPLARAFRETASDDAAAARRAELALLIGARGGGGSAAQVRRLLNDERGRAFLRINLHGGVTWFDKERFEELARGLEVAQAGEAAAPSLPPRGAGPAPAPAAAQPLDAQGLISLAADCGYRLDDVLARLDRSA